MTGAFLFTLLVAVLVLYDPRSHTEVEAGPAGTLLGGGLFLRGKTCPDPPPTSPIALVVSAEVGAVTLDQYFQRFLVRATHPLGDSVRPGCLVLGDSFELVNVGPGGVWVAATAMDAAPGPVQVGWRGYPGAKVGTLALHALMVPPATSLADSWLGRDGEADHATGCVRFHVRTNDAGGSPKRAGGDYLRLVVESGISRSVAAFDDRMDGSYVAVGCAWEEGPHKVTAELLYTSGQGAFLQPRRTYLGTTKGFAAGLEGTRAVVPAEALCGDRSATSGARGRWALTSWVCGQLSTGPACAGWGEDPLFGLGSRVWVPRSCSYRYIADEERHGLLASGSVVIGDSLALRVSSQFQSFVNLRHNPRSASVEAQLANTTDRSPRDWGSLSTVVLHMGHHDSCNYEVTEFLEAVEAARVWLDQRLPKTAKKIFWLSPAINRDASSSKEAQGHCLSEQRTARFNQAAMAYWLPFQPDWTLLDLHAPTAAATDLHEPDGHHLNDKGQQLFFQLLANHILSAK